MNKETEYANSVYEQPWWLDIVAPGEWNEVIVEKKGKVIARLPYVLKGGIISNPFQTQTLGIWMDDSIKNYIRGNSHLHKQKEAINELIRQLPNNKGIDITLDSSVKYVLPFRWLGFRIEPTFSYRITDLKNIEDVDKLITSKTVQRHVKAAEKVVVVVDNSEAGVEKLIELQDMTFRRQGRKNPYDKEMLRKIMNGAIEMSRGTIMLAEDKDGNLHSGAFYLYDKNTCYYLLGGQNPDYKNDGSQNLILRKGIEFATEVSENFDFEGSMIEGIENFFRQYGGTQIVNYRVTKKSAYRECMDIFKPRIKKILGYKN